ncbi:MAG: GIY-YIG nuclease family protein [Chitinophagaceae bacterium]|nr:GIY-YIG nuclease family protein [Chitinophagaceae bacterium]
MLALFKRAFFMYHAYALYAEKYNKHYYGFTSNLEARLLSHNELGKDWTAKYRPWKVIHVKEFDNKQEAAKYEKWMKSGVGRAFIKLLPH